MTDPNDKPAEKAEKTPHPFPSRPPCAMPLDAEDGDGFRLDYDLLDGPDDEVTR